jgi:hypothetical protein
MIFLDMIATSVLRITPAGVASGFDGSLVSLQSPQGMTVGLTYL